MGKRGINLSHAPWYKRYPERLLSDPQVQGMTDEQAWWYSKMLDLSWINTPQGYLSNDIHLISRMVSKSTVDYFIEHSKIVIAKFTVTDDGLYLFHPVILFQANKMKEVSENKSHPGKSGRKSKNQMEINKESSDFHLKSDDEQEITDNRKKSIDIKEETKPCPAGAEPPADPGNTAEPKSKKKSGKPTDPRFKPFIEGLKKYWNHMNQGGLEFEVSDMDGRNLKLLLEQHPKFSEDQFLTCLRNRSKSAGIIPSQSFGKWISNIRDYHKGPLTQYKQPEGDNGNGSTKKSAPDQRLEGTLKNFGSAIARRADDIRRAAAANAGLAHGNGTNGVETVAAAAGGSGAASQSTAGSGNVAHGPEPEIILPGDGSKGF